MRINSLYQMLQSDIFILEKLDFAMRVRKGIGLIILVSLPLVSFTYLVLTDMVDVSVFSENFFSGLEITRELEIKLQTQIEEEIDKIFLP